MNVTCPSCEVENAYLELVDETGSHYTCPDCDYEWTDSEIKAEDDSEENGASFQNFDPKIAQELANQLKKVNEK